LTLKRVKLTRNLSDAEPEESPDKGGFLTIRVNKDWRLKHDGLQFSVQQRRFNAAKGVAYWSDQDIFVRSLDTAISFLASRRIYLQPVVVGAEGFEDTLRILDAVKTDALRAYTKATSDALTAAHKHVRDMRDRMPPADYTALMKILDPIK
jgi:hypothetical protein